jgi:acetyl/propionyl-CoA carboxylase alpha subunit
MTTQAAFIADIEGVPVDIALLARKPTLLLELQDRKHRVVETRGEAGAFELVIDGKTWRGVRYATQDAIWIRLEGRTYAVKRALFGGAKASAKSSLELRADMPGTIVSVHVSEGGEVEEGTPLITIESMKLQLTLNADRAGRIAQIARQAGATFDRGDVLLSYADARTETTDKADKQERP